MQASPATVLASGAPTRYLVPYLTNLLVNRIDLASQPFLRSRGLTVARWQVLCILMAQDGSRVTSLAELAGASQPVTSRVVDQMERDGLVERRPDPDDQRAAGVWLTDTGRDVLVDLLPRAAAVVDELLADLDEDEVDQLARLLVRVLARTEDGVGPSEALRHVPFVGEDIP